MATSSGFCPGGNVLTKSWGGEAGMRAYSPYRIPNLNRIKMLGSCQRPRRAGQVLPPVQSD